MKFAGTQPVTVRGNHLKLTALGDIHYGSPNCAEKLLKATVEKIASEEDHLVLLMGDLIDGIDHTDKRWEHDLVDRTSQSMANLVPDQFEAIGEILSPLKGRIIGALYGNHELVWMKRHGVTGVWRDLCRQLACPSLGYTTFFNLGINFLNGKRKGSKTATSLIYPCAASHGAGGAITPGGKLNRGLAWARSLVGVNAVFYGHVHALTAHQITRLATNVEALDPVDQSMWVVFTGSYLKAYDPNGTGYAEVKNYEPAALGSPTLYIHPDRVDVSISSRLR